jgi:hypothetical protein
VVFLLIISATVFYAQNSLFVYSTFEDYLENKGELQTGNLVFLAQKLLLVKSGSP